MSPPTRTDVVTILLGEDSALHGSLLLMFTTMPPVGFSDGKTGAGMAAVIEPVDQAGLCGLPWFRPIPGWLVFDGRTPDALAHA